MTKLIIQKNFFFKVADFTKLDNQLENTYFISVCVYTYTSTIGYSWIISLVGFSSDPILQ